MPELGRKWNGQFLGPRRTSQRLFDLASDGAKQTGAGEVVFGCVAELLDAVPRCPPPRSSVLVSPAQPQSPTGRQSSNLDVVILWNIPSTFSDNFLSQREDSDLFFDTDCLLRPISGCFLVRSLVNYRYVGQLQRGQP